MILIFCKPCAVFALIPFLILGVIMFTIATLISWSTHKSQVRDFCKVYGKGNYKIFKREFDNVKWGWEPMWRSSLFDNTNWTERSQIHAGIFQFQGKGMILGYFDYLRAQLFLWNEIAKYRYKILEQNVWK